MSQSNLPNHWIMSYIEQNHLVKSRYEIDLRLLQLGHKPSEIEVAWNILNDSHNQSPITKKQARMIAEAECQSRGWFWEESCRVTSSGQNWHADSFTRCMGWHIYINKVSGRVVKANIWGGRGPRKIKQSEMYYKRKSFLSQMLFSSVMWRNLYFILLPILLLIFFIVTLVSAR